MATIPYDRPVKDLIAGLNATEHVTHTEHRKTMVTIHHNAGRLSHEDVLNTWKTRESSAHFDCDAAGAVAQYVKTNEYAWACGNTTGNQISISIEMANSAVGGSWPVSELTWGSAARLSGWLFARVIGSRPTRDTLVGHSHWKATACPGPSMTALFSEFIASAQRFYDQFTAPVVQPEQRMKDDMTTRLVRGDSTQQVPGKPYTWGSLQFLVHFDPELPGGAIRKYMPGGGAQTVLEQIQGGVDVVPQAQLDKILYAVGGTPPVSVTS